MSRPLRLEYPGAWYHLMNRGRRDDQIFADNKDRAIFLTLLKEAAKLWHVHVSAFCLMDNHYHILAQTPQGNLARFMRHLNGVYTQSYNRLHGYDGQLFRGRYKSILVEEGSHLLEAIRYIHRNPVRAEIVATPDQYPWSSHHGYLAETKEWNWLHKSFPLSMLTSDTKKQQQAYRKFMAQEDSDELIQLLDRKKWPILIGGEEFISWIRSTFFQKKRNRQIPEYLQLAPEQTQIIRQVYQTYKVTRKSLLIMRRGLSNEPRDVAIYLCRILRNDTLREIGKVFGMTGYAPAGLAVNRIRKKLSEEPILQDKIGHIINCLLGENNVSK